MAINLLMNGMISANGFQSELLERVRKEIPFQRCVISRETRDDADCYDASVYCCINYDISEHNRYEEICDWNNLEPLDKELLEAMKPYELTAMQMLIRNYERNIYTMDESRAYYLHHLRFWNHIIKQEQINFICTCNIPHHTHDYIIYALGRIYQIPMCVCADTSIMPRLSVGNNFEDLWQQNEADYQVFRQEANIILPEDIEHYYQALLYSNEGLDHGVVHRGMSRKEHIQVRKKNFTRDFTWQHFWHSELSVLKRGIKGCLKGGKTAALRQMWEQGAQIVSVQKRGRVKLKSMRDVAYYNKMTQEPVAGEKYVIFFLHLQPEATTLPQGGVFVEQELMIQILAAALEKKGIRLYVKEHFVQPYRDKRFYDELSRIRNVRLIHSDKDSKELAKNSVATASCNGTILLESIFNGKPTFIFGYTGFAKAPGVFELGSVQECERAIEQIESGAYRIDQQDVRAYLKAFANHSIRAYFDTGKFGPDHGISYEEGQNTFATWLIDNLKRNGQTENK